MGLWEFEWKKLWKNKIICTLMLGCIFLNLVLVYRQTQGYREETHCFPQSIKAVYAEMARYPEEKQMEWLSKEIERAEKEEMEYERRSALSHVMRNMQEVYGYQSYLMEVQRQNALMSESALFSETDSFSKRNAQQISGKYKYLYGLTLQAENPQGVLLATESKMTDICLVVLIVLLAYFFICMEREDGTMAFARTTRYGTKILGKTKTAAVIVGSMAGALILYGSNYVLAEICYGFGDIGRWIQSVQGYLTSPWRIRVYEYLFLFLLGKMAAAAVIASVVLLIALRGKSILKTSVMLLGVTIAEYGMYGLIPEHSSLDILKKCNLFYLMRTEKFFDNYATVNLFGYPVSSLLLCSVTGIFVAVSAVFLSIISYEKVSKSEYTERKARKRTRKPLRFGYECYKIFWVQGAAVIMLLFLAMQVWTYSDEKVYFSLDELYYKNYMKQLEGDVTEEKLKFIKEEGWRIRTLKTEEELRCQSAYLWVRGQTQRIGKEGVFLNEVGYLKLLDRKEQMNNMGKLLVVFVLSFHAVFIVEETSGMSSIWNTIPNGRKKIRRKKWILLTGCVIFLCLASDLIFIGYRMKAQKIASLQVPICYLPGFESWKNVTVSEYLAGGCLLKVLAGMLTGSLIAKVSEKAKNATTVLLLSGGVTGAAYLLFRLVLHLN